MNNKNLIVCSALLFAITSVFTGIPIVYREWILIIAVTFLGPFILGYLKKGNIFVILMTAIYLSAGLKLPRYFQNKLAKKN